MGRGHHLPKKKQQRNSGWDVTVYFVQLNYFRREGALPISLLFVQLRIEIHYRFETEFVTIAVNRSLRNCEIPRKKKQNKFFGASTGFEPVASAFAMQCSTSWATKTNTLEAGQFIEFINPWKEWNTERNYVDCGDTNEMNNTEWNDVNCGNTNEMSMWPSQWIAI